MHRKIESWSDERIREWSGEHVAYEIQMFIWSRRIRVEGSATDGVTGTLHNALVEAAAVHGRVLASFLYKHPQKADDVVAGDFFGAPREWLKIRGEVPSSIATILERANKEVAHLTISRRSGNAPEKAWSAADYDVLDAGLEKFAAKAMPERLHEDVPTLLRLSRSWQRAVNIPAMSEQRAAIPGPGTVLVDTLGPSRSNAISDSFWIRRP